MDGYDIEMLYYLYRQGCPIAWGLMVEYFYLEASLKIPGYFYYNRWFLEEREDLIQSIVIRCIQSVDSYRPDKGMMLKGFIALLVRRTISTVVARKQVKNGRDMRCFSLDDFIDENNQTTYNDIVADTSEFYSPYKDVTTHERIGLMDDYIANNCSGLEQRIIKEKLSGYRDEEIAENLDTSIKNVYNATYRIQKKMAKFKYI